MLEYDVHIALTHGKAIKEKDIVFPKSTVLYLGNSRNVPKYETCTIHFQDGSRHVYRVPVINVQGYDLKEIEERHLNILLPFLLIRFREQIEKVAGESEKDISLKEEMRDNLKKELAGFLSECGMILDREGSRGVLRENAQKDIREFFWKACEYLLEKDAKLYEEVSVEVEPAIKLSREIIEELREDIKGLQKGNRELQKDNGELQDSNKEFHRKQENSCRNLIRRLRGEGKSMEEAEEALVEVFSLTKREAEEKVRLYWEK